MFDDVLCLCTTHKTLLHLAWEEIVLQVETSRLDLGQLHGSDTQEHVEFVRLDGMLGARD